MQWCIAQRKYTAIQFKYRFLVGLHCHRINVCVSKSYVLPAYVCILYFYKMLKNLQVQLIQEPKKRKVKHSFILDYVCNLMCRQHKENKGFFSLLTTLSHFHGTKYKVILCFHDHYATNGTMRILGRVWYDSHTL